MRSLAVIAAAAAALVLAASAGASGASRITKHDRDVIRFFSHHPRLARTAAGGQALYEILPHVVTALRTPQSATMGYPPHHRLWLCISRYESSDWHNHGPGHYGGLQMSWNWGNGIVGDAGDYTQVQQEWAAENGYRKSGYSYSFLYGQWYEWDAADGCGTTG